MLGHLEQERRNAVKNVLVLVFFDTIFRLEHTLKLAELVLRAEFAEALKVVNILTI